MKTNRSNLKIVCKQPPKLYNMKIFTVTKKQGLSVYLSSSGGKTYFLTTRRLNRLLYSLLKDGMKIDELRRLKPNGDKKTQKTYDSIQYLLKIVDSFIQYELEPSA